MIIRNCLFLLWFVAAGCAGATPQASTMPSAEHGKSLEAFARQLFAHIDRGDWQFVKSTACPNAVMFDIDEKGSPIAAWGKAEVDEALDRYAHAAEPGTTSSTIQRIQCEADAGMGFCALEFDQSGNQTTPPMMLRGTLTGRMHEGHWIWTSWHGSLREPSARRAGM